MGTRPVARYLQVGCYPATTVDTPVTGHFGHISHESDLRPGRHCATVPSILVQRHDPTTAETLRPNRCSTCPGRAAPVLTLRPLTTGIDGQPCHPPYELSFVDHGTNGPRHPPWGWPRTARRRTSHCRGVSGRPPPSSCGRDVPRESGQSAFKSFMSSAHRLLHLANRHEVIRVSCNTASSLSWSFLLSSVSRAQERNALRGSALPVLPAGSRRH
jgi:hypothetical protein